MLRLSLDVRSKERAGTARAFVKILDEACGIQILTIAEPLLLSVSLDHTERKAATSAVVGGSTRISDSDASFLALTHAW